MQRDRLMDNFDIPLVPLQSIQDLPATLLKFHRSFLQADSSTRQAAPRSPSARPEQSLLPYCVLSPPLGEHSSHLLSDLTVGFADLVNKVSTAAKSNEIVEYVGQKDADRIVQFWVQEYLL